MNVLLIHVVKIKIVLILMEASLVYAEPIMFYQMEIVFSKKELLV